MLPVAPKLLRTISIHYLESNEYVLDGEATFSADGSLHGSTLSTQDATNTDLKHNTVVGSDSNTCSLLSLKRNNSHAKRKSHRSISMDGVLHRVPYGTKVSVDIMSEVLPRSTSATYDRDGPKPYVGIAAKRHVDKGFRRSRSLTESLESYSRILDSIANSESKRTLTILKSTRDHSLDGPNVMSSFSRTSNAEFRLQVLTGHDETLEDALESHNSDAEKTNFHGDKDVDERPSAETTGGLENLSLPEECISDKKCDVAVSTEARSCTDPSPSEVVDTSTEQEPIYDVNDQVYSATGVDSCDTLSTQDEVGTLDQHATICDDDEIQSSMQSDLCILSSEEATIAEEHTPYSPDSQIQSLQNSKPIGGTFCVPDPRQEFEADISCEPETESPMSVLDAAFSDDPISPIKHTMLDDTSLKPRILHLNDADVSTGTGAVQENDSDDTVDLQVDPAHEDEFNYVNQIFNKSSFSNETLYDQWHSQNITALQDEDCQHYETAAAAFDFTDDDMSAEQLLLFDLTNEALLDIHKKHSVCKSWFSSFSRPPKHVGRLALRELWAELSRRMDERPRSTAEVDTVLAKDLARSDCWTSFQRHGENIREELGEFVLGRLLAELILELAEF